MSLLLQLFISVVGAGGSYASVRKVGPSLLVFSAVQVGTHFGLLMLGGRVFRLRRDDLLLASNAAVGGPSTAAAMATAKRWTDLVLPALLVGILGYSTATFLSLGLGPLLRVLVRG